MQRARGRWEPGPRRARDGEERSKPTVRQIYALARALCDRCGEEFPQTRHAASALIARLRADRPDEREAA